MITVSFDYLIKVNDKAHLIPQFHEVAKASLVVNTCVRWNFYKALEALPKYFVFIGYLYSILVKARTGSALFDRRRGKKYLKGEAECLRYIYQTGFFSLQLYVFHVISRIFIRNLPISGIRGIYKLLR
jgi:hypothetical protein